ncbi:MAG: metallophosphoesterase family protein [Bacteroidaceae bacterium]|nr:metallophosphoesterase family protein [Bacteroidaceae bacterium]
MNRRHFIQGMAMTAAAAACPASAGAFAKEAPQVQTPQGSSFHNFTFNAQGKFRIMQITDTHYIAGDARSKRAMDNLIQMLDTEKPDLVIHTGDIIFAKPAERSFDELFAPIIERKIPFAVALGNHDEEFGMSRLEVYNYLRSKPYCINTPEKGIHGASNDVITLSSTDGKKQWVFYLLDTMNRSKDIKINAYDYLHFDQIQWYREQSQHFRKENGGTPVPALAFMHIPVFEHLVALADSKRKIKGNLQENPCPSLINSGMFSQMQEMGDVMALFSGHDHDNDYVMKWQDKYLIYGRYSGCNTVYNNLEASGCRMIELTQGQTSFRTYVRVFDKGIEQDMTLPKDMK